MPDYVHVAPGTALPDLSRYAPFKAVVVLDLALTAKEQDRIASWLVASGCLYMMAWGIGCSEFHDQVDLSSLQEFDFGKVPEDRHIMTTWHENEPLEGPLWFVENCAYHPVVELKATLILHVAEAGGENAMLSRFEEAQRWTGDDGEASTSVT